MNIGYLSVVIMETPISPVMKALILLGTLKKDETSHTEVLCDFFGEYLQKEKVEFEVIKLVNHRILPGTYTDMGKGDEWPTIFKKIIAADILILATPIWWNSYSSEIQRVIERLDEIHDEIMEGKKSKLEGKTGGIIITGDSDGAQHIIAGIANFYNAMGTLLPPFATLSVLWGGHGKNKKTTRGELMKKYKKDYHDTAKKMASQLVTFSEKKK